jgi:hypothetical protein
MRRSGSGASKVRRGSGDADAPWTIGEAKRQGLDLAMDHSRLRAVIAGILGKFENGDLPINLPHKMYSGYGSSAPCDACGDTILPAQIEYEWGYPNQPRIFRMHLSCTGVWESLRRERSLDAAF